MSPTAKPKSPPTTLPCGRPRSSLPGAQATAPSRAALDAWQEKLRQYLTAQGLKYSEQRWKIAELILSGGGHLDAQALVERVKSQHPDIGAATVYRNLKVLVDAQILKESLTDSHGRGIYELFDEEHHDHMVCVNCGEIFEFHDEEIEERQAAVAKNQHFTQVKHRHVIYVRCDFYRPEAAKRGP